MVVPLAVLPPEAHQEVEVLLVERPLVELPPEGLLAVVVPPEELLLGALQVVADLLDEALLAVVPPEAHLLVCES